MIWSTLVYLTILSGVLGQLLKLPLGEGNLYPVDLLVGLAVFGWFLAKLVSRRSFKVPFFWLFGGLFIFWSIIGLIHGSPEVSVRELWSGSFYLVRFIFYALFSLVIIDLARQDKNNQFRKRILAILLGSGVILALAGFVQLLIYPDLSALAQAFGYDPHRNRLVSTFLDPNFTGAYLVLTLILALTVPFSRRIKLLITLLLVTGLLLTFSRSAWIMAAAGLFLFGFLRSRKLLLGALIIFLGAYLLVPRVQTRVSGITDPDDSAQLRFVSWSRAWEIFSDQPIFGVGFNLYRQAQDRFGFFDPSTSSGQVQEPVGGHAGAGSDSSFLLVLATTGIIGFILFLLMWGRIFVDGLASLESSHALVLLLSLFGLLFESQFINSLFFPQIMLWLWILVGLFYSGESAAAPGGARDA